MHNTVKLLGYYGSDETHACSAWTSTSRDLTDEKRQRIPALLKMLAKEGHHSVFEKSSIHFLVNTDIATHIHLLKHRIGVSVNAESARYKELKEDKIYIPEDWFAIEKWARELYDFSTEANELYHAALKELTPILGRKRAKESCRYFKTYATQIESDVMFNWRSFYHFLSLRKTEHAQLEINQLATEMFKLVSTIDGNPFRYTIEAFNEIL